MLSTFTYEIMGTRFFNTLLKHNSIEQLGAKSANGAFAAGPSPHDL